MSENTFRLERHKDAASRYRNQENMYSRTQNVKIVDNKSDVGKRKGLSENRATRTSTDKSVIGKAPFQVYQDNSDENIESRRSRVRNNVCKKELKAKRDSATTERMSAPRNAMKLETEKRSADPALCVTSRRARSSSNSRNKTTDKKGSTLNSKYCQRSNSESRKTISQRYDAAVLPRTSNSPKAKNLLSNEVKRRTSSSIQMWKDKMRKQHTGALPKNYGNACSNVPGANRIYIKAKSRDNSILNRTISRHRSNTVLDNLIDKIWQHQSINPDREQIETYKNAKEMPADCRLKSIIKCSNEIATFLGSKDLLCAEASTEARSSDYKASGDNQDDWLQLVMMKTTVAASNEPVMFMSTPKKAYHEKPREQRDSKKGDDENVYQISDECYYLEDMLSMERKKEEHAPKLSPRFLQDNMNADQRKVIVGYLIRLGVHCNYSSHIIYQTIKLFDVIIDRILVETDNIQLIALTCLWINLKRETIFIEIPSATMMLQLAKDMYTGQEKQLLMYEKEILLSVNFNICFADPFSLLFYYIWCANQDDKNENIDPHDIMLIYFCGSYLLDVTMLNERLCDISGCILAMVAIELSLHLIYLNDIDMDQAWYRSWRSKIRFTEWEERAIKFAKWNVVQQILESSNEFGLNVVYKKYLRSKHGRVSNFLLNRMENLSRGKFREVMP